MNRQWTKEEAWEWYNNRPWICGFNYVPANCATRFDMWQEYEHEKKLPVIEKELEVAHEYGYNSIRIIASFECWYYQHDGFMARFENFISLCAKNQIGVMVVFGNDCTVPKEQYSAPVFGPQHVDFGYHGGIKKSPHAGMAGVGYSIIDEPDLNEKFVEMVREIVTKYAKDPRIEIWDIFNELGNGRRKDLSVPTMEHLFAVARECDPIQPMTACTWTIPFWASDPLAGKHEPLTPWERRALELSDIISYHDYRDFQTSVMIIDYLKKEFGRPMLNTEWLNRIQQNTVQTHLPLFYLERIGCYQWGLVAGLNQTYEPWDSMWTKYYNGEGDNFDFTQWMHDILRPNYRPYDPREMEIFKKFTTLAKMDFESKNK